MIRRRMDRQRSFNDVEQGTKIHHVKICYFLLFAVEFTGVNF